MIGTGSALVAISGTELSESERALLGDPRVAGVTLYRTLNVADAEQVKSLCDEIQSATAAKALIAVDQEGGQLIGAGAGTTQFAGNMALGAAGSPDLTRRVYRAMGNELRALGISVNYAPVADVATRPDNPSLGIRAFGDDPALVAEHVAAAVEGMQSTGVAATLKHFPGKGEAAIDPHHGMPVLDLDRERLEEVEFVPFRAGIEAGAKLLMVGHYGLPAIIDDRTTPTSVSPRAMKEIRESLGFHGVIVTDALDMGGFGGYAPEAPLEAGVDLLLYGPAQRGNLPNWEPRSNPRITELLDWLGSASPVETDSQDLAAELARRSISLVRDRHRVLPLSLDPDDRVLAVMPRPIDLTPADISSLVTPTLAPALRAFHSNVTELIVDHEASDEQISHAVDLTKSHRVVIVGTIAADPRQAALVEALLGSESTVVTVALRTPYDLNTYPGAMTYLCTYGIHRPSMDALAAVIFGKAAATGKVPVRL